MKKGKEAMDIIYKALGKTNLIADIIGDTVICIRTDGNVNFQKELAKSFIMGTEELKEFLTMDKEEIEQIRKVIKLKKLKEEVSELELEIN